jgi:hypothetical protein
MFFWLFILLSEVLTLAPQQKSQYFSRNIFAGSAIEVACKIARELNSGRLLMLREKDGGGGRIRTDA